MAAAFHKASRTLSMSRVGTHRKYSVLQAKKNSHKLLFLQDSKQKMVYKSTNQAKQAKCTFQSFHNAIRASFKQSKRIEKDMSKKLED